MSQRNGDKSRFGRQRRQKRLRRQRTMELRNKVGLKPAAKGNKSAA